MNIKKGIDTAMSTPLENNITLNFAMAYIQQLNYTIFPIHFKSKVPMTKRGFHDASKDIEQIKEWFEYNPNSGIAMPTGKVNGVIAIDIDPRNGGQVSFERLIDEYEPLPHTVECLTAGGGNHYYFKYDEKINISMLKGYPGIDILSDGKYAVLPPSYHPNGRQYHWEDASKPVITQVAELPSWFVDLATNRPSNGKYKAKPVTEFVRILQGTEEGQRNNDLMALIGRLVNRLDYREVYEVVHIWNESGRVSPPLDKDIITKAINNIIRLEIEKR